MFRKGMQPMAMFAFTLALTASAPAVAAGAPHSKPAAAVAHEGSFVTRAWQWMQSLWAEQGACIDPDGKCANAATVPTAHTDQGGCLDPDGRCAASPHQP